MRRGVAGGCGQLKWNGYGLGNRVALGEQRLSLNWPRRSCLMHLCPRCRIPAFFGICCHRRNETLAANVEAVFPNRMGVHINLWMYVANGHLRLPARTSPERSLCHSRVAGIDDCPTFALAHVGRVRPVRASWSKRSERIGKLGSAGVLRLRATNGAPRDRSVRRSAQDDAFAGNSGERVPPVCSHVDTKASSVPALAA
jgi:hypothetical protein